MTAQQMDRLLAFAWRSKGLYALRDPLLASKLGLSKTQREELVGLCWRRQELADEVTSELAQQIRTVELAAGPNGVIPWDQLKRNAEDRRHSMDGEIWAVLTSRQAKMLERMLSEPPSSRRPAMKKKRAAHSG